MKKIFHRFEIWSEKKSPNAQKGATLVEFAIIALVLFTLLFAIIEFGVYLYNQQVITNASREGARAGIVIGKDRVIVEDIKKIVDSYCKDHLVTFGAANDPDTDVIGYNSDAKFGDNLEVTVNFDYGYLFLPFMPKKMEARTVMKYE
jgi:Flp pilus assembly protein TadG